MPEENAPTTTQSEAVAQQQACSVTAHCAQGPKQKPMKEDLPRTISVLRAYTERVERRGGFIDSDFVPTLRAALHHLESLNEKAVQPRERK